MRLLQGLSSPPTQPHLLVYIYNWSAGFNNCGHLDMVVDGPGDDDDEDDDDDDVEEHQQRDKTNNGVTCRHHGRRSAFRLIINNIAVEWVIGPFLTEEDAFEAREVLTKLPSIASFRSIEFEHITSDPRKNERTLPPAWRTRQIPPGDHWLSITASAIRVTDHLQALVAEFFSEWTKKRQQPQTTTVVTAEAANQEEGATANASSVHSPPPPLPGVFKVDPTPREALHRLLTAVTRIPGHFYLLRQERQLVDDCCCDVHCTWSQLPDVLFYSASTSTCPAAVDNSGKPGRLRVLITNMVGPRNSYRARLLLFDEKTGAVLKPQQQQQQQQQQRPQQHLIAPTTTTAAAATAIPTLARRSPVKPTNESSQVFDIYLYLIHPLAVESAAAVVATSGFGRESARRAGDLDNTHSRLLNYYGVEPPPPPQRGVSLVIPATPEQASSDSYIASQLTLGLTKALLSALPLTVTCDPCHKRVKQISTGVILRLLMSHGYRVLPGPGDIKDSKHAHFQGGHHESTTGLVLETCLDLDMAGYYPSIMRELGLELTDEEQAEALREDGKTLEEILANWRWGPNYSSGSGSTRDSGRRVNHPTTLDRPGREPGPLSKWLEYMQQKDGAAYKLVRNGLYGAFGSPTFRFYYPSLCAMVCLASRTWLHEMAARLLASLGADAKLVMAVMDSLVVTCGSSSSSGGGGGGGGGSTGGGKTTTTTTSSSNDNNRKPNELAPKSFLKWLKSRFACLSIRSSQPYEALLILAKNRYVGLRRDNTLVVRGLVSRKEECPPLFGKAFETLVQAFLEQLVQYSTAAVAAMTASDKEEEEEDKKKVLTLNRAILLDACRKALDKVGLLATSDPPAPGQVLSADLVVRMTLALARSNRVQLVDAESLLANKTTPVIVTKYSTDAEGYTFKAVDMTSHFAPPSYRSCGGGGGGSGSANRARHKPRLALPSIEAEAWRLWYLRRYIAEPFSSILYCVAATLQDADEKKQFLDEALKLLYEHFKLPPAPQRPSSQQGSLSSATTVPTTKGASLANGTSMNDFWHDVETVAGHRRVQTSWSHALECAYCHETVVIDSDDVTSREAWKRRVARREESICPKCRVSLVGSFRSSASCSAIAQHKQYNDDGGGGGEDDDNPQQQRHHGRRHPSPNMTWPTRRAEWLSLCDQIWTLTNGEVLYSLSAAHPPPAAATAVTTTTTTTTPPSTRLLLLPTQELILRTWRALTQHDYH